MSAVLSVRKMELVERGLDLSARATGMALTGT